MRKQNSELYTDERMSSLLKAMLPVVVPQYARQKYVDWSQDASAPSTIRDMLPKAFSNISLRRFPDTAEFSGGGTRLTDKEIDALTRITRNNPYAAQEFERAGVLKRNNGTAYINANATREHVNALGGMIASMFAIGMRGAPSAGIDDIEDPAAFGKLKYRDNLYVNHARQIASELSEAFEWLEPIHRTAPSAPAEAAWRRFDGFRPQPRQTTMEFIEFEPSQVAADGVVGASITEDGTPGKHKYLRVNQSLMQSMLSKQQGATPFTHNGFNNNEIFMR